MSYNSILEANIGILKEKVSGDPIRLISFYFQKKSDEIKIKELVVCTKEELLSIRHIGKIGIKKINDSLEKYGLHLGMTKEEISNYEIENLKQFKENSNDKVIDFKDDKKIEFNYVKNNNKKEVESTNENNLENDSTLLLKEYKKVLKENVNLRSENELLSQEIELLLKKIKELKEQKGRK